MQKKYGYVLAGLLGLIVLDSRVSAASPTAEQKTNSVSADNTGINERDRQDGELTAEQQGSSKSDTELTRQIRKGLVANKELSTYGHNVKIITVNGVVTLKGPVRSQAELNTIQKIAKQSAGNTNVRNEMQVTN